jgi:hypothetical protein
MLNKPRNLDDLGAYTNNTRSDERIWLCSIYCTYFIHFDGDGLMQLQDMEPILRTNIFCFMLSSTVASSTVA